MDDRLRTDIRRMTRTNKALRNMDRRRAKKIAKTSETVVLTRPMLACLFPLTIAKCKYLSQVGHFDTVEQAREKIVGIEVPKFRLIKVFEVSDSFERLAKNEYEN